jgi:transketolase N-terminal domain/subunit
MPSKVVCIELLSCMDALQATYQNTNTMEEGNRSEIVLSQHVNHGFYAALLIGRIVRLGKVSDAGPKSKRCPSYHSPA